MADKYVGLDVHKATTSYCVRESTGKVVAEGVVETSAEALVSLVRSISGRVHVALEEGTQAQWLYELLNPLVSRVVVCDPSKLKNKGNKNDRIDASRLAELLRLNALSSVYHGEHGTRGLKELVRAHRQLVQDVVRMKNRVMAIFRSRGVAVPSGEGYHPDKRDQHVAKLQLEPLQQRLQWYFEQVDVFERLRREAERSMLKEARRHRGCRILKTVPGIGPIRAAQIVAVADTPHRFRTSSQWRSYVGFAVVMRSSSDYRRTDDGFVRKTRHSTRGLNRNCNRFLKAAFKSAALDAIAKYPDWKAYFETLCANGLEPEIARVCVARKLAGIALTLWKKGEHYDASKLQM